MHIDQVHQASSLVDFVKRVIDEYFPDADELIKDELAFALVNDILHLQPHPGIGGAKIGLTGFIDAD